MARRVLPRRWIALCAAYVVALQALLLPLSVAAASPIAGSLCVSAPAAGNAQTPIGHDTGCACAAGCGMACSAHAVLSPPQPASALTRTFTLVRPQSVTRARLQRRTARTPQNPRAPPVV